MCNNCFRFCFCACSVDCVVFSICDVMVFLFVFRLSFVSPSVVAWLKVKGVGSGLLCDMFCDVFVALSH